MGRKKRAGVGEENQCCSLELIVMFEVEDDRGQTSKKVWVHIQLVVRSCLGKEVVKRSNPLTTAPE